MLKRLKYSVTFVSTGRTLAADLDLTKGFTAITGPNESGKSMIFEMARYLLFGTDALRGPADHYRSLKAEGVFVIRGQEIEIVRTVRTASVKRNGEVIATGTKAANMKLVEELGFGLQVFDVACSINQGEVERLGEMRPAARKAMVDSVLGLGLLDNVARWAAEEARLLTGQAESLRGRLLPPGAAPVRPADYVPSTSLVEQLTQLRAESDELAHLNGFLSVERSKPSKPETTVDLPAENLVALAERRAGLREQVAALEAQIKALPVKATFTAELLDQVQTCWDAHHRYEEAQAWLRNNPRPQAVSFTQLSVFEDDYRALDNIAERARLTEQIEALKAKGSKFCPHCGGDIPLEQDAIERLVERHDALEVPHDGFIPQVPPISRSGISVERERLRTYDAAKAAQYEAVPAMGAPELRERDIPRYRQEIEQAAQREALATQLSGLRTQFDAMPDFERMLVERRAYEAALESWRAEQQAYNAWLSERATKQARQAALRGAPDRLAEVQSLYETCRAYEAEAARHSEQTEAYVREMAVIEEIEAKAAEHRKVREVMNTLRGLIKQHVLPSLNKVASHLLRQMTGGQRGLIFIDDEFNVMVDRQELETLSGSGKAIANLAIRIALGQVLTNRVISILLADEIDASMDAFRAEKTSNVLRILEENISQVLLVSHKPVEATHHVRLGGFSDDEYPDGAADLGRAA